MNNELRFLLVKILNFIKGLSLLSLAIMILITLIMFIQDKIYFNELKAIKIILLFGTPISIYFLSRYFINKLEL